MTDVIPGWWHLAVAPAPRRLGDWTYAKPADNGTEQSGTRPKGGSAMNATPGTDPTAAMRASDADRDAVLSDLSEHFQAGRLTAEEFDERAGLALAARTWGELKDLLRDLPAARPGPQVPAAASSAARPERSAGRRTPAPIPLLAVIGIAVAVSVGLAHGVWGVLALVWVGLLIARRRIYSARTPGRSGPEA